jgi:hypothetical protein
MGRREMQSAAAIAKGPVTIPGNRAQDDGGRKNGFAGARSCLALALPLQIIPTRFLFSAEIS